MKPSFVLVLIVILDGIKTDLAEFGVNFEKWFLEQSLIDNGFS